MREAVGARMTRWLLYTGELLSAERACEIGLVQQVFPAVGFQEAVLDLAQRIVARRIGDSLARVKALTVSRDPTPADRELEIAHSIEHYFDPRIQTGLDDALTSDRAKTG